MTLLLCPVHDEDVCPPDCEACQGFQLVELDYGLARPGLEWVA